MLTGYRLVLAAAAAGALAFAAACVNPTVRAEAPAHSSAQSGQEAPLAPVEPSWGRG